MTYGVSGVIEARQAKNNFIRQALDVILRDGDDIEEFIIDCLNHSSDYEYEETVEVISEWLDENPQEDINIKDLIG